MFRSSQRLCATVTIGLAFLFAYAPAQAQKMQGGLLPLRPPFGDCIAPKERQRVQRDIYIYHLLHGNGAFHLQSTPQPYPFHPQAGNLWGDLWTHNFVDLDPTSGILSWDGTDWSYNRHRGHDTNPRSFGEQDIGVPIFAALDGVVVAMHDGEFDKRTDWNPAYAANYVVLWHGGTHYTYYWHLKMGSVAVQVDETVKAGKQIGMTGSSGISTYPHLHFESWFEDSWYEPYAGPAQPGPSYWVNQILLPISIYLQDFNFTNADLANIPGLPYDMPRTGTFVKGVRDVRFWIMLQVLPPESSWRVLYERPDETIAFDSGTITFNNSIPYRSSWWWWHYILDLNMTGRWTGKLLINDVELIRAPFDVVETAEEVVNRPPNPMPPVAFDPIAPKASEAIFCRIPLNLLDDPDYDLVRHRYQWYVNGILAREVITAADSDAIPRETGRPGDLLRCVVTPMDAQSEGESQVIETILDSDFRSQLQGKITLTGCQNPAQELTFTFRPVNGGPAFERPVRLESDGSFTLSNLIAAPYTLHIKGAKWLAKNVRIDLSQGDVLDLTATLTPGDINGNNRVNLQDLALLRNAFGTQPDDVNWDERADLNCDGRVNLRDLALVRLSLGQQGDP